MRNSKFNFCLRHSSINNAKKISGSISLYGQKLSQAVTRERTKSVMNTKMQISSAEQNVHPLIDRFKEGKHCFTSTQNTATSLHTAKCICYPEHRCVCAFLPCLNSGYAFNRYSNYGVVHGYKRMSYIEDFALCVWQTTRGSAKVVFCSGLEGTEPGVVWACLGCYSIPHMSSLGSGVRDSHFWEEGSDFGSKKEK